MALEKKRIIDIEVGQSVKNIDNLTKSFVPLRKQIKDLITEMGQLEQGTEEYNRAAAQLADLQQRQREVAEAAKYSNKDFGAVMSNLTTVSLGFAGGINAISASMALLGGDSEKMQKALAPIQLIMAAIQGFSAMDNAIKSLKGFNNMLSSLGQDATKAAESVTALSNDMDDIGDKKVSVDVDTKEAEQSVVGLENDIDNISGKTVNLDVDTNRAEQSVSTIEADIESIGDKKVSIDIDTKKADKSLEKTGKSLDKITGKKKKVTVEADTKKADKAVNNLDKEIKDLSGTTVKVDADTTQAEESVETLKAEVNTMESVNIPVEAYTEDAVEAITDVTEAIDDIPEVDIEFKAEGLETVKNNVENLAESEKKLATNVQTAATATNNLNTATKSTATSTSAMAAGAKTAAVASATLAAGEGVATKASWTLTGAIKAVGTAIKSIPVIGWIMMAVSALTALIKLIVKANKESDAGEQIAQETLEAERKRRETLDEIYEKYRKIWNVMMDTLDILKKYPKDSREYKDALEDIASYLGVSKEFAASHADSLKNATNAAIELKKTEEQIKVNEEAWNKAGQDRENLIWNINDALQASWNTSNKILQNMVDERKITEDQMEKIQKARKDIINGEKTFSQAQKEATYIVQDRLNMYEDIQNQMVNENAELKETVEDNKKIVYAVQNQSDAYDKMLEKQKEGKKAAAEFHKKYLEAQKAYIELMEEMAISDAEYNGDWNRYADERKNKAERIYNDDLKEYKKQLKEKLITQEQYDNLVKAREEQYNNDIAQIKLESNKKMWDQMLKDSLEAIEKEKQARIKAANEQYVSDTKKGVSTASETKNIASEEAELEAIRKTNEVLKQRLQIVQENKDESAEYAEYVKELQDQIAENEQKAQELQTQIDLDGYEKRKKEAETYYNSIDQLAADRMNQSIIDNNGEGNNLFLEQQQIELQAIRDKMEAVKQSYEEGLITEAEYHSRSLELQAEYVARSKEYDEQHQQSILQTASTYVQTVQMLGSSISGVLQEVMANYDENSEEYKKMAVANAVIQTISGQLGAFFSGVNSGVPAPWNFLLGGVLATAALTTGLIGIANIKSGKLGGVSGNISTDASNLGSNQYETTLYSQQSELLGNVRDQRVYVLEHDISNAQNNVNVMESDNTF